MPLDYQKLSLAEQRAYNKDRNARIVSLNLSDPELKERLKKVAEADGRTLNNWLKKYVVPIMRKEIDAQYAQAKGKK